MRLLSVLVLIMLAAAAQARATENEDVRAPATPTDFASGETIKGVSFDCEVTASRRCTLQEFIQYARVCALIVVRNSAIALEYYSDNPDFCEDSDAGANGPDRKYGIASVTKSLTSTLLGHAIAMRYGAKTRHDFERILGMTVNRFVERLSLPPPSAYVDVSLHDLVRMRSGVSWNELGWLGLFSDANQFSLDVRNLRMNVRDFARRYRWRDNLSPPEFNYKALDPAVAALVAERMVGPTSLVKFLETGIWAEIGAEHDASWGVDRDGGAIGPCCFRVTARDLARFGLLVLNKGSVEERQVIPKAWFDLATKRSSRDDDTIPADNDYQNKGCPLDYRYFWWFRQGRNDFTAVGRDGQFLHIYPDDGTVIVQISDWKAWRNGSERECETFRAHDALVRAAELIQQHVRAGLKAGSNKIVN